MSKKFYLDDFSDEDIIENYIRTPKKRKTKKNKKKILNEPIVNEPILNIEIDNDENDEKVIILSVDVPLEKDDVITFDVTINKNLYLLIGKELFS